MKILIGAALSVALAFGASGAFAKGHPQCRDHGKFVKCPPAATPAAAPAPASAGSMASMPMGDHHPVCKKGKPCGNSCIAMNKVCHK